MSEFKILLGNSKEKLKEIPDNSVDCCITSPPYYGLRDYGTGRWVGGDPNCPHRRLSKYSPSTSTGHAQPELAGNVGDAIYKTVCPLCGAVREDSQIGLEETPEAYVASLMEVFEEVRRVLKPTGTFWLNIGDTYNGAKSGNTEIYKHPKVAESSDFTKKKWGELPNKSLIGIPWRVAFALQDAGWTLRQDIIWHKPNPMPESVKDRCVKSHEYIFLLSKEPRYFFDYEAIQEEAITNENRPDGIVRDREWGYDSKRNNNPEAYLANPKAKNRIGGTKYGDNDDSFYRTKSGNEWNPQVGEDEETIMRNKRDVWTVKPDSFKGAHFTTFPPKLIEPMVLAGCPREGVVLDPFTGSGTTGVVALLNGRNFIGCELNPEYHEMATKRIQEAWEASPSLF